MFLTPLSFPRIPEVVSDANHLQADSVLKNLKLKNVKDNSPEYLNLQRVLTSHALDMIDNELKTKSICVNSAKMGIREIVCHKPVGGTRVLRIYPVTEATWTKNFTGDKWRVDTKTVGGAMTDVKVKLNKDHDLVIDMHNEMITTKDGRCLTNITVTNISISNAKEITFGPNKRAVSIEHLIGIFGNPKFMDGKFNKNGKAYNLPQIDLKEYSAVHCAIDIMENSIMPIDNTLHYSSLYDIDEPCRINVRNIVSDIINCSKYLLEDSVKIYSFGELGFELNGIAMIVQREGKDMEDWAKNVGTWYELLKYLGENICKVE
tara:strand:- start:1535 stop:2491 length:957 start_codon:yes stop_codon:yes gene_type:complete